MKTVNPPLRMMGSKVRQAHNIIPIIQSIPRDFYFEPFFGIGGLFFNKPYEKNEIVNDINGLAINFFRTLKTKEGLNTIVEIANKTPMAREFWYECRQVCRAYGTESFDESLKKACLTDYPPLYSLAFAYFYTVVNDFGSGLMTSFATIGAGKVKDNKCERYWNKVNSLEMFSERLKHVVIENKNWNEFNGLYDNPNGLIYFDPPYENTSGFKYPFDHNDFFERLKKVKAKTVVSCYDSDRYQELLDYGYEKRSFNASSSVNKGGNQACVETVYFKTK